MRDQETPEEEEERPGPGLSLREPVPPPELDEEPCRDAESDEFAEPPDELPDRLPPSRYILRAHAAERGDRRPEIVERRGQERLDDGVPLCRQLSPLRHRLEGAEADLGVAADPPLSEKRRTAATRKRNSAGKARGNVFIPARSARGCPFSTSEPGLSRLPPRSRCHDRRLAGLAKGAGDAADAQLHAAEDPRNEKATFEV